MMGLGSWMWLGGECDLEVGSTGSGRGYWLVGWFWRAGWRELVPGLWVLSGLLGVGRWGGC